MKRKHSKYRKIWLLWVALEGLVATFAIMSSFLLLRYLYFSNGTAIPEASVSTATSETVITFFFSASYKTFDRNSLSLGFFGLPKNSSGVPDSKI